MVGLEAVDVGQRDLEIITLGALARAFEEELRECVVGATFLAVNDYEFEMLTKKTGLSREEITSAVETVIITRGEEGSHILHGGRLIEIPVAPADSVADPTGAGDAFAAGFLAGWLRDEGPERSLQRGVVSASFALEAPGAAGLLAASPEETEARFRRWYGS